MPLSVLYAFDFILPIFVIINSFLSFAVVQTTGYFFSTKDNILYSVSCTFISFFFMVLYFFFYGGSPNRFILYNWMVLGTFNIEQGFYFDTLNCIMIILILFVTLIVQCYCIDYMQSDPFINKFYAYLSVFSFFMLFLVSSNNFMQMFLGQEGVGVASFLLISFQSTRKYAAISGLKAMLVNRVGDVFFIFAMVVLLIEFKTLNLDTIFSIVLFNLDYFYDSKNSFLIAFFITLAAMAKSAQLGLHTQLADAMEGPTPVSALLHAATMVTAGVFILIRVSPLIAYDNFVMDFITIVGSLTVVFGASVACFQYDIKKIIAYSTVSQIGYMMFSCGVGNFIGAFFHLLTHAFFKALLFLCAGSIIHALGDEQDIRKMGGLYRFMPFTYIAMFLGFLSLMGFPFFSGYYSKDYILESAFITSNYFAQFLGLLGVFFTNYYSIKTLQFVFFSYFKGSKYSIFNISESPTFMSTAIFILIFPSISIGYIFSNQFMSGDFENNIIQCNTIVLYNFEPNQFIMHGVFRKSPLFIMFVSFIMFYQLEIMQKIDYIKKMYYSSKFALVMWDFFKFFSKKQYFDVIYNGIINFLYMRFYNYYYITIEKGFFYQFGPLAFIKFFKISNILLIKSIENSSIKSILLFSIACISIFISIQYSYFYVFSFAILLAIAAISFIIFLVLYIVNVNNDKKIE